MLFLAFFVNIPSYTPYFRLASSGFMLATTLLLTRVLLQALTRSLYFEWLYPPNLKPFSVNPKYVLNSGNWKCTHGQFHKIVILPDI